MYVVMASMGVIVLNLPNERPVFLKEQNMNLYGTLLYYVSKNIVEFPFSIIIPLIDGSIVYWMVGLAPTASQFFTFYLIYICCFFCGTSLGFLVGCLVKEAKNAALWIPAILLPLAILSGFMKNN